MQERNILHACLKNLPWNCSKACSIKNAPLLVERPKARDCKVTSPFVLCFLVCLFFLYLFSRLYFSVAVTFIWRRWFRKLFKNAVCFSAMDRSTFPCRQNCWSLWKQRNYSWLLMSQPLPSLKYICIENHHNTGIEISVLSSFTTHGGDLNQRAKHRSDVCIELHQHSFVNKSTKVTSPPTNKPSTKPQH